MKEYTFLVREVVEKYVTVEAENEEEAEQIALQEDVSRNFDNYSLDAELVDEPEVGG